MTREEFDKLRAARKTYEVKCKQRDSCTDIAINMELNRQIVEIGLLRLKLQQEMDILDNGNIYDALHLFYIAAQPMKVVAANLGLDYRYTVKLVRRGEEALLTEE